MDSSYLAFVGSGSEVSLEQIMEFLTVEGSIFGLFFGESVMYHTRSSADSCIVATAATVTHASENISDMIIRYDPYRFTFNLLNTSLNKCYASEINVNYDLTML